VTPLYEASHRYARLSQHACHATTPTDWLAAHLKDSDLRIFDASWYLPAQKRDAKAEYAAGHIPGARFFDIDEISDLRSELPHTVPPTGIKWLFMMVTACSRLHAFGGCSD